MTSVISPPTNQPTTSQNVEVVQQGTTDECSMDVDESPSMKADLSKNGNNPNQIEFPTSTSTTSNGKPMLDSKMTDAESKITKENKKDSFILGGTIEKQAFALLTGLYEVRSICPLADNFIFYYSFCLVIVSVTVPFIMKFLFPTLQMFDS